MEAKTPVVEAPRSRPGRDMLVGTPQAEEPEWDAALPARRGALRGDVYQAFTRIAPAPVVYSPDSDRFLTEENAEGRSVRVPDVALDTLIQDRREFAESLEAEIQQALMDALTRSPNPLSAFRQAVERLGILDKWGREQTRIVWRRVERYVDAGARHRDRPRPHRRGARTDPCVRP